MRVFSDSQPHLGMAIKDIIDGFGRAPLWLKLAWMDIKLRYRGSVLGPLWLTLSMGTTVAALGFVYSQLFDMPAKEYVPFLASGLILWNLISTLLIEGCNCLTQSTHFIKQIKLPYSTYIYRTLFRNFLVFAHNLVVFAVVALLFGLWPGENLLIAVPGLLLIFFNAAWLMFLLGSICARFRDVVQIVTSLVQIIFFITPVIWKPQLLRGHEWLLDYNPLHHFMDLVRAPLLGNAPEPLSWLVVLGCTLLGWGFTLLFLRQFRRRLAYWV